MSFIFCEKEKDARRFNSRKKHKVLRGSSMHSGDGGGGGGGGGGNERYR